VVSECKEDNPEDLFNASYVTSCAKHQFEIFGVRRKLNKILNTGLDLQFRNKSPQVDSENRNLYLSCNGKRCRLLPEGECPTARNLAFNFTRLPSGECPVDSFKATIV